MASFTEENASHNQKNQAAEPASQTAPEEPLFWQVERVLRGADENRTRDLRVVRTSLKELQERIYATAYEINEGAIAYQLLELSIEVFKAKSHARQLHHFVLRAADILHGFSTWKAQPALIQLSPDRLTIYERLTTLVHTILLLYYPSQQMR